MYIFTEIASLTRFVKSSRRQGVSIGAVPTMGALHRGHIELVKRSVSENDMTIASIFVNPIQFNNPSDLTNYPRTPDQDYGMLEEAGCSAVFAPEVAEMYPVPPALTISFGSLETVMEGAFRPGHFAGVGVVVAKLFHILSPDNAYFGQKDLQQTAVIGRLINDLSFPVNLVICPTVREDDGLAMSSRNRRLTETERRIAPEIYNALRLAQNQLSQGLSPDRVKQSVIEWFEGIPEFRLEYFEICNRKSLEPIAARGERGETALCIAAYLGAVRLIDNVVF